MANTNAVEEHSIDKKEYNACSTDCDKNKNQAEKVSSRVKVQWLKGTGKVAPSERDLVTDKATTHATLHVTKVENNNRTEEQDENKTPTKITEDSVGKPEQNKTAYHERGDTTKMGHSEEQDTVTEARLRAQRRWRMGLLKRSKLGGIGQDVTGLFPDYFPTTDKNEEDDILTSLKESKQRHRAKLLKQNSIDKIDRELGDRETKIIAGSWLQIYS